MDAGVERQCFSCAGVPLAEALLSTMACHLLFSSTLFKVMDLPGQRGLSADVEKLEGKLALITLS